MSHCSIAPSFPGDGDDVRSNIVAEKVAIAALSVTNGRKPNLFHSFGNFTVGTGDLANVLTDTGLPTSNMPDDGARTLMSIKHPASPNGARELESAAARVTQPVGAPTMPPDRVMQKNQSFPLRR